VPARCLVNSKVWQEASLATVSRGEVRVGFGAVRIYQLAAANALHCRINAADSERAQVCVCGGGWSRRGKWEETRRSRRY
jgi:hypothetical protein